MAAVFAINTAVGNSMGSTPHKVVYAQLLSLPTLTNIKTSLGSSGSGSRSDRAHRLRDQAVDNMRRAQMHQKGQYAH